MVKNKSIIKKFIRNNWSFIFIFISWFIFSSPFFFKGLTPFPSKYLVTFFPPWNTRYSMPVKNAAMPDVITQIYPWKKLTVDTYKIGQIPLWNPYSFSGTVHAANYQSAVFNPLNILFFFLSFSTAWSLIILFQPLFAGIFMILYLKSLNLSQTVQTFGAIAFMFCGFITVWMAYGTLGYALLFLPLSLYAVEMLMNNMNSFRYRILLTLSLVMSFVSGHFQISVYVSGLVFLYICYKSVSLKDIKILRLIIYLVLALLILSPQLFLTYQAYTLSSRSASFVKGEVIPWRYIFTLFAPDFYGNSVTRNDWFGHYAEWALYIGVLPLIFSIYGFVYSQIRIKKFLVFIFLICLLLSYQSPLVDILFYLKIPVLSTSAASRIISIASFCLCVLGALGLDSFIDDYRHKKYSRLIKFASGVGIFLVVFWVGLYFSKTSLESQFQIAVRNSILSSGIALLLIFLILSRMIKTPKLVYPVIAGIVIINFFDMLRFSSKWMPFESVEYLYPQNKLISFLQSRVGNNRIFGNLGGEVGVTYKLGLIEGYDAMYQARYGEFVKSLSSGTISSGGRSVVQLDKGGKYKDIALKLMSVRYIVHRKSDGRSVWAFPVWEYPDDQMRRIYEDEFYEVYEYEKALPRTYLVSSYILGQTGQDTVSNLIKPGFNPDSTVILEKTPEDQPQPGTGSAKIVFHSPNRVKITTQSNGNKLLYLSDVYDAGWKAFIDNRQTEIIRANFAFRAVSVPAGIHTIEFRYFPDQFKYGLYLSFLALSFLVYFAGKKI